MKLKSHAKINLTLKIGQKLKKQGLHKIESVMQPIDLFDNLTFEKADSKVIIESNNESLLSKDNLAYKAAMLLKENYGVSHGAKIRIEKHIPIGAGLGGGSSNAASTLLALNSLWKLKLNQRKLAQHALDIGTDVPFFIYNKPALVEGVGDKIKPIKKHPKINTVIVNPGFQVSTEWAYKAFDKIKKKSKEKRISASSFIKLIEKRHPEGIADHIYNDFTEIVSKKHKTIKEIQSLMNKYGALNSCLTGTGPTVFGLFNSIYTAREAYFKLKDVYPFVYLTKTI